MYDLKECTILLASLTLPPPSQLVLAVSFERSRVSLVRWPGLCKSPISGSLVETKVKIVLSPQDLEAPTQLLILFTCSAGNGTQSLLHAKQVL